MRPQDLTTATTLAKISVVSNTAGGKKSAARRSTGLDYSSGFIVARVTPPLMIFRSNRCLIGEANRPTRMRPVRASAQPSP
jgi:hypothetical protein